MLVEKDEKKLVVAVTGASGSVYAACFIEAVLPHFDKIFLTVTDNAKSVIRTELGGEINAALGLNSSKIEVFAPDELDAAPASGSVKTDGMVVVPCSMGTAGRIASGVSNDLVTRAADVCLKEGRKLILVVRETPLNLIHLRNLTALAEAGAVILPAAPAFYNRPKSIDDLAKFVVDRVMMQLGLSERLTDEWERRK